MHYGLGGGKKRMTNELNGKLPCYNCGVHCLNSAVAECDLGDGKGVKFYCRGCIEWFTDDDDPECYEVDESLVFCQREWDLQGS